MTIPHGTTVGKLYRFRGDCDECCVEAWERMTDGGWNRAEHLMAYVQYGLRKTLHRNGAWTYENEGT